MNSIPAQALSSKSHTIKITALTAIIAVIPFAGFQFYKIPGFGMRFYEISTFSILGILIIHIWFELDWKLRKEDWIVAKPLVFFALAVFVFNIFSWINSFFLSPDKTIKCEEFTYTPPIINILRIIRLLLFPLFAAMIAVYCRKPKHIMLVTKWVVAIGFLNAAWGLLQLAMFMMGIPFNFPFQRGTGIWWTGSTPRIRGFCYEPLALGNILLPPLIGSFFLYKEKKSPFRLLAMAAIFFAIVLTFSTSTWVMVCFVTCIYIALMKKGRRIEGIVIMLALFAFIGIIFFPLLAKTGFLVDYLNRTGPESLYMKLSMKSYSSMERMNSFNTMWGIIKDHWLLGVGPGNLAFFHNRYNVMEYFKVTNPPYYPLNEALQIAGESGIFSLLIWIYFFAMLIMKTYRTLKIPLRPLEYYAKFIFLSMIGIVAQTNFGFYIQFANFWIIIGLAVALTRYDPKCKCRETLAEVCNEQN